MREGDCVADSQVLLLGQHVTHLDPARTRRGPGGQHQRAVHEPVADEAEHERPRSAGDAVDHELYRRGVGDHALGADPRQHRLRED